MTRPSLLAYLFGNPLSMLALGLGVIVTAYQCYSGTGSAVTMVAAIVAAAYAANAQERITAYRGWKREWDAMGGDIPRRRPLGRRTIAIVVWSPMALVAAFPGPDPQMRQGAALFWWANAAITTLLLYRAIRSHRTRRRDDTRERAVTVVVGVPRQSTTLAAAYAALPDHCQRVLAKPQHGDP